jgi:hypothetical protein
MEQNEARTIPSMLNEGELLIFLGSILRLGTGDEEGESCQGSALGLISLQTPMAMLEKSNRE